MPKAVKIGNMKAHLDPKTGFIRLTSCEPGSALKQSGFVVNVMPNSKEYELLLNSIIGGSDYDGITEYKVPHRIDLSDKYRSKDWRRIPLGLSVEDMSTVYWNVQVHDTKNPIAPQMLLDGATPGAGSTLVVEAILDHFEENSRYIDVLRHNDTVEFPREKKSNTTYYASGDSTILKEANRVLHERYEYLEKNRKNSMVPLIEEEKDKALFVIIENAEKLFYKDSEYDTSEAEIEKQEQIDENYSLLIDLLRLGRAAGVHVLLVTKEKANSAPMGRSILPGEYLANISTRLTLRSDFENGRRVLCDTKVFALEDTIVPFFKFANEHKNKNRWKKRFRK